MFIEIDKEAFSRYPFLINDIGYSEHQMAIDRPHGFEFHHIFWVVRGTGQFTVCEDSFSLTAGHGILLQAGVPHSYTGDFSSRWITFSLSADVLKMLGFGTYFLFDVPENFGEDADDLSSLCSRESTALSRSAVGYSFFSKFISQLKDASTSLSDRVRRMLESRCREPLTLDEIAENAGTDRFFLCRQYRAEKNTTVMEDLKKIRIAKAKRLLRYTELSLSAIGAECGFESPSYFALRFREETGISPGTYRKKHKK